MRLTSEAKKRFEHDDLMERGRALIQESINFGVTHMRAFVEVDLGVQMKCLEAGLALKEEFSDRCHIQICVFAQDPIISYRDSGRGMMRLLEKAASRSGVEVFGSTPYVETNGDLSKQIANIEYAIKIAKRYKLHLDFHIDYNLDPNKQSAVMEALRLLHKFNWPTNWNLPTYRTIVFGHCTRLTLFDADEWNNLSEKVRGLPVSFVGLPTSDIFMMGRPTEEDEGSQRVRGTLQVLHVIRKYGMNAAIGVNNVGNAFTPQGSSDPLSLASLGVGLYQAGTKQDVDLLLVFGLGMLAHAISALLVFSFGFRPFVNFYGCTFILYELSSPFLNFHWFFDKLDMTGSKAQLYNGLMLLFTFFCCRLCWGTYQSVRVYQDVWNALHHKPATAGINIDALNNGTASALDAAAGKSAAPIHSEIMRFAGEEYVPLWLAFTYLGSNIVLNTLNFYWFGKMIQAVKKRFTPAKEGKRREKPIVTRSTSANGKSRVDIDDTEVRKRNIVVDEQIEAIS
ncbi:Metallo-dependent hydrolase [Acephala macrosclerotiorum]|nr:Metallo-dependent hydrolase [Acephala macrosclerotiorum]